MNAGPSNDGKPPQPLLKQLDRLLELSPRAREADLQSIAVSQPGTAARLERMLANIVEAESWIGDLERSLARGLASELDTAWAPGRVVGPYRLERLLATGGMDAVFLARKADGELKRPVALKLVPPGLIDAAAQDRFRRERDLLARLVHPNIAQLIDAGVTEDGQPWFAMEYIEGVGFDRWCQAQRGGARSIVRSFRALADAVAFAHRNLVVHGDLKPANVMIDAHGRLRLLDFGVARMLDEVPDDHRQHWYTERYAAPEVRQGHRSGIAADIYSLGIMLEELAVPASPPGQRRRELAAIAGRAAAATVESRFDNARQLAEDLGHWLDGAPVAAREGGFWYRLGKRVRRYPWVSAGLAFGVALLVAFAAVSRIQAERFENERDTALQLAAFLERVFVGADPEYARGETLTARELLDRGVGELAGVTAPAAVRSRLLAILGRTYQRLGDYQTAGRLMDEAAGLAPSAADSLSLDRAETYRLSGDFDAAERGFRTAVKTISQVAQPVLYSRAKAGLGRTLAQAGRPAEALPVLEASLAATRKLDDIEPAVLAERLNDSGSALFRMGDYEAAVDRLEEALALRRRADRASGDVRASPRTATLINNIGLMHYLRGRPDQAEPRLREALALRRSLLGGDHPDLAQTLTNLGLMLKDYGDVTEAASLLEEALKVRRASLEDDHFRIGQAMLNLAIALRDSGEHEAAEGLFEQSLARLEEQLGSGHPQTAVAYTELGQLFLDTARPADAEAAFRTSLEIRRMVLDEQHPHLAWSLLGLGRALLANGRPDDALPLLREAVEIRQNALPPENSLRLTAEAVLSDAERAVASISPP